MKIGIYISELLFEHDSVILPGLGEFTTKYVPAKFIPEEKKIEPPSKIVAFNPDKKEGETPLIGLIAAKEKLDEEKVKGFLSKFVEEFYDSLKKGKKVELEKIGLFSQDPDGNIVFEPDTSVNYNQDAAGLTSVKEPEKTDTSRPAEKTKPEETTKPGKEEKKEAEPVEEKEAEKPKKAVAYHQAKREEAVREPRKSQKAGLPPALKWVAFTAVPLLVIIIILALNFDYFFGDQGIFRATPVVQEELVDPVEPEALPEEDIEVERDVTEVVDPELEPAVPDPSVEPPKPEPGRPVYYIVVGSFENPNKAEELALELRKDGAMLASVFMRTPAGFHRVCYGYYYDLAEAEAELRTVKEEIAPEAYVLHR